MKSYKFGILESQVDGQPHHLIFFNDNVQEREYLLIFVSWKEKNKNFKGVVLDRRQLCGDASSTTEIGIILWEKWNGIITCSKVVNDAASG